MYVSMSRSSTWSGARIIRRAMTTTTDDRIFHRRCRILDAARNFNPSHNDVNSTSSSSTPSSKSGPATKGGGSLGGTLKCFRLTSNHFSNLSSSGHIDVPPTPTEFHANLCDMIRSAKHRVYLASLYIGPGSTASTSSSSETEFLDALTAISSTASSSSSSQETHDDDPNDTTNTKGVEVKIVLDANRALRPIPIITATGNATTTTSSAEAVAAAISSTRTNTQDNTITTSNNTKNQLYLFQVVPDNILTSLFLPTPLDEVYGVFHIKAYVIDDTLILSGANLSEEYFVNRQDRYIQIKNGGNGLVEFYANLIDILCNHSIPYHHYTRDDDDIHQPTISTKEEFLHQLEDLFLDKDPMSAERLLSSTSTDRRSNGGGEEVVDDEKDDDERTMAICIPTFQFPSGKFWMSSHREKHSSLIQDTTAIHNLLHAAVEQDVDDDDGPSDVAATTSRTSTTSGVKLSSAYLNPTDEMVNDLRQFHNNVELLTAGRKSHGFRPKKKKKAASNNKRNTTTKSDYGVTTGSDDSSDSGTSVDSLVSSLKRSTDGNQQDTGWIPKVFDHLMYDICQNKLPHAKLLHWERDDWTYHSKGLWLVDKQDKDVDDEVENGEDEELIAAIIGSGNYGQRSYHRDMESNCIFIFPPSSPPTSNDNGNAAASSMSTSSVSFSSPWQQLFQSEWKAKCQHAKKVNTSDYSAMLHPPLPFHIKLMLPYIKSYF